MISGKTSTNGVTLAWDSFGEGEPLVLIMGLNTQRIGWPDELCEQLAERGFRVLRFDNRDVGESTWLTDTRPPPPLKALARAAAKRPAPAPYTLSDMARDVVGLLDGWGIERAHVAGASLGGMVAQHLAIEHPDRLQSLTSIMSGPGSVRHMVPEPRALRALLGPAPKTREENMDRTEAIFRVIGGELPLDWEKIREGAGLAWDRGFNSRGFLNQWAAMCASGSRLHALKRVRTPSLVLHGSADPLCRPLAGRATAAALPDARHVEIAGMGHALPRAAWPQLVDAIHDRCTTAR